VILGCTEIHCWFARMIAHCRRWSRRACWRAHRLIQLLGGRSYRYAVHSDSASVGGCEDVPRQERFDHERPYGITNAHTAWPTRLRDLDRSRTSRHGLSPLTSSRLHAGSRRRIAPITSIPRRAVASSMAQNGRRKNGFSGGSRKNPEPFARSTPAALASARNVTSST
jgi:hypothetical protein